MNATTEVLQMIEEAKEATKMAEEMKARIKEILKSSEIALPKKGL